MQQHWINSCLLLTFVFTPTVWSCPYPGSPAHSKVSFVPELIRPGTVASYECEPGFELLGPPRRVCSSNNTWTPAGIPFCVMNVAAGKAPMQSSIARGGLPENAVDGSTSNFFDGEVCSMTEPERTPWWYVNLLEPYMVQLVRLDFGLGCCGNKPATIVVRVGNSRPDLGVNPICNRFTGFIEEGRPLFLPCNPPVAGAFVSVHLEDSPGNSLSICEAFVYTDQALPIERCPQFRDQEPGSTASYNGMCYMFHDRQRLSFNEARQFCEARGGSLIDETNPALQGFISWELWRRHRGDPVGQYWMGAIRDPDDRSSWRWINGQDVTLSFWNLPGGGDDCARFDGTKGWLWSDTNCNTRLFFICQHRPKSCGRPEQPPNSTMIANSYSIGTRVEVVCDPGHALVGPFLRTCLPSGSYSDYPPICKYVQCGLPARITNGAYQLVNGTRHYLSTASYSCAEGYQLIGRGDLICDVDGRWNGPPPRCERVHCPEPPQINNGGYRLSNNSTVVGTTVSYYCQSTRFKLSGSSEIVCQSDGHYDRDPPVCLDESEVEKLDKNTVNRADSNFDPEYTDDYFYDDTPNNRHYEIQKTRVPPPTRKVPSFRTALTTPRSTRKTSTTTPKVTSSRRPTTYKEINRAPPSGNSRKFDVKTNSSGSASVPSQDNEIADTSNIRNNAPPDVSEPKNKIGSGVQDGAQGETPKLNLGGIIALGVFGGFVFLAAMITTLVIVIRRVRNANRHQHRRRPDRSSLAPTPGGSSSHSSQNKSYRRDTWGDIAESKRSANVHNEKPRPGLTRKETLDDPNFRLRASGEELIVADVYPKKQSADKKHHHHHHHHHKHGHRTNNTAGEW